MSGAALTTILTKVVPAGKYVITAKVGLEDLGVATNVECDLLAPDFEVDVAKATVTAEAEIALQATTTFASQTAVSAACKAFSSASVSAQFSQLNLTEVGTIQ